MHNWIFNHLAQTEGEELRVRQVVIGARALMALSLNPVSPREREYVQLTEWDLPEGARVVAMELIPVPPAVVAYVEHPSFDPVPLGEEPPVCDFKWRMVKLKRVPMEPDESYDTYEPAGE